MASQPNVRPPVQDDDLPMRVARDYRFEWRDYARRRFLARTLLFLWIPVVAGGFIASRFFLHVPLQMVSLMLVWTAATVAAIVAAGRFRCPRCRRRVGSLGRDAGPRVLWRGLFDKVCPNCYLHRFEQAGADVLDY